MNPILAKIYENLDKTIRISNKDAIRLIAYILTKSEGLNISIQAASENVTQKKNKTNKTTNNKNKTN